MTTSWMRGLWMEALSPISTARTPLTGFKAYALLGYGISPARRFRSLLPDLMLVISPLTRTVRCSYRTEAASPHPFSTTRSLGLAHGHSRVTTYRRLPTAGSFRETVPSAPIQPELSPLRQILILTPMGLRQKFSC